MINKSDNLNTAMNKVAQHLPSGWNIEIRLEKGSGEVVLLDDEGQFCDYPSDYGAILDQLNEALTYAIECAGEPAK